MMARFFLSFLAVAFLGADAASPPPPSGMVAPAYDADGALVRPEGYREWISVGSSLGLSYSEHAPKEGPGNFHHVYIQREAYTAYKESGLFPEKTMLVMENFAPCEKDGIDLQGWYEGPLIGVEVALKDSAQFEDGWAYFNFSSKGGLKETAKAFPKVACWECHDQHAADDNVFVQFYPVLRAHFETRSGVKVGDGAGEGYEPGK